MFVVQNGFTRTIAPAEAMALRYSKRDGFILDIRCFGNGKAKLAEYGKTWALTKEELEEKK